MVVLWGMAMAGLLLARSASAQDPPSTNTTLPGAVQIGPRLSFAGAVVIAPDGSPPRTLDAYHAAVFVQSWLPEVLYGTTDPVALPAGLPVYRVEVTGTWGGPTGTLTVYYASDGATSWVSFPEDQVPASAPTTPPPPSGWFVAPARVIDAFSGAAFLDDTIDLSNPARDTTSPTTADRAADPASPITDEGIPLWSWLASGAAAAAIVAIAGARRRRRRPR